MGKTSKKLVSSGLGIAGVFGAAAVGFAMYGGGNKMTARFMAIY